MRIRVAAGLVAALVLAGCGGGEEAPAAVQSEPPPATASPSAAPQAKEGRLLFARSTNGNTDIYAVDGDGKRPTRLTRDKGADFHPSWSPDRSRIVFVYAKPMAAASHVYVMNADGTARKKLSMGSFFAAKPAFSPDGKSIVFSREGTDRRGPQQIFLMNADGTGLRQLTDEAVSSSEPVVTADGSRILVVRQSGTGMSDGSLLYSMNADGTGIAAVTSYDETYLSDASPAVSSDGQTISFTRFPRKAGEGTVWTIRLDGTGLTLIDEGYESTFSPDGLRLAIATIRDQDPNAFEFEAVFKASEIYVVDLDGGGEKRLTKNNVADNNPAW
ncbi:MAG: TolB family protein [Sporichthyaceae bacterium]